ncbi:MAG: glutamine-hydrolyzing carbamoyl-phosphate synthase small subunit [Fervidicoccaceae archaeon]
MDEESQRSNGPRPKRCRHGLRSALLLEDGLFVEGCGFGFPGSRVGEIVFTTSMVGYPESLTDPSYRGQILVVTHPLVGNYGVPSRLMTLEGIPLNYESDRIQVEGLVVAYETEPSHWASECSLHEWLAREGVPGASHVDTRALVKRLREKGTMMAALSVYPENEEGPKSEELARLLERSKRYDDTRFVDQVTVKEPTLHEPKSGVRGLVVVVDCGVKYGILRELLSRRLAVLRIPCGDDPIKHVWEQGALGVVLGNGPGNPSLLSDVIKSARAVLEYGTPALGICLGHQLLAIASGASVYKLRYGHRGSNKPVQDLSDGRCYVTTQNHGYALDPRSLDGTGFKLSMVNVDDRTVEGLIHEKRPVVTVQFHPEASPGPRDTTWVFDLFLKLAQRAR